MRESYYLDNLKAGDRIVLPKSELGLIQHHAIYIGRDNSGERLYIENHTRYGVQMVSENHLFRDGYYLTKIVPFTGNIFQQSEAIKRAIQLIGKPYNLVNFNCEHYANTVQHNRSFSKQVSVGVMAVLLGLVLGVGFIK